MRARVAFAVGFVTCVVVFTVLLLVGIPAWIAPDTEAAGGKVKSPTGVAPDRYVYYQATQTIPRTEVRG